MKYSLHHRFDGPTSSDHVLEHAHIRLRHRLHTAARQVKCHFREGRLMLSGRLPSWYLKQLAQEAVRGLDEVSEVENRIQVAPQPAVVG